MSGPSLDASGVLTWKLLHFLASQRPSAQERRGDRRLDNARTLAGENGAFISRDDLEIVKERIILATEIKLGLESKRGLPKYLQAREYRKAANDTLKFVKTVSDRAKDATLGQSSAVAVLGRDMPVQRQRWLAPPNAVPLQATVPNPILIGSEASTDACNYPCDPLLPSLCVHSGPRVTGIGKQLCAEMIPKFATLVENMFKFKTSQSHASISYNARRSQELLRDMTFIYLNPRTGRDPYRHPIIQRAIDTTWFCNKDANGVVYHEYFSPMPVLVIALTLTVIECCIDEWSDGTRRDTSWDDQKFQTVYDSHVSSLLYFQAHSLARNRDLLYQLQCDLLRNAREHAGVLPDPVTGLSRFPPGALDAVCEEEDNQPSPLATAPPNYNDIPGITIHLA